MADPKDAAAYNVRFGQSQKLSGFGPFGTKSHVPCPFCAAPDWLVFRIIDTEKAMERGAVCGECKRGARAVTTRTAHGLSFHLVQTEGPDAPSYSPFQRER